MAIILDSPASPFCAKVRMASAWCGLPLESRIVDADAQPPELVSANPLGKIPALLLEDGDTLYDSRAITQHLNRVSKGTLFPRDARKRMEAERLEALADGICDCLITLVYERRHRPEEKVHQPWMDRQWTKVSSALDLLNASPPKLTRKAIGGQIALRAALGYLSLRFEGKWERGRSRLTRWARRFDERFPELVPLLPRA